MRRVSSVFHNVPMVGQCEYTPRCQIHSTPCQLIRLHRVAIPGHYVQTWHHLSNRKYITYRNAIEEGPSHGHRQQVGL